jgi:hypothetical protein
MRIRIGIALLATLALALAACSDDSDDSNGSSSTTSATPSTSPVTVSVPVTSPPTTAGSTVEPQQCAEALFSAWAAGNQSAAPSCASSGAVQQMFSVPFAAGYQGPNCQGAAGSVFCTWTGGGPVITMEVRNTTGGLPVEVLSVNRMGPGV